MYKKIGLALGAGGARGFAHIGVLRALEENNIKIDCVSGTSMGSIIGGIYACGTDMERVQQFFTTTSEKMFMDYTFPKRGAMAGRRFEELIKLFTKDMSFEDLTLPFNCVACDLISAKGMILDTGKIYKAIRCSMSVPGMFEPYNYKGCMFVDGAVVDRVPIQACREMGADYIIGVDVGYKGKKNEIPKNVFEIMNLSFDIMGWEMTKLKINTADCMIMPDVTHIHPYKMDAVEESIEIGYNAAMEQMEKLKQDLLFF